MLIIKRPIILSLILGLFLLFAFLPVAQVEGGTATDTSGGTATDTSSGTATDTSGGTATADASSAAGTTNNAYETLETSDVFDVTMLTAEQKDEEGKEKEQEQKYFTDQEKVPIMQFILDIINFLSRVLGAFALILIIIGGLIMIVSQGNENLLQRGQGIAVSAIIGLVIALAAYFITTFVQSIFYLE